jgi:hypothetical protein
MPEISFLLLYQPFYPEGQWLIGVSSLVTAALPRGIHTCLTVFLLNDDTSCSEIPSSPALRTNFQHTLGVAKFFT